MQRQIRISGGIKFIGCTALSISSILFFQITLGHVFWSAKEKSHEASCISNAKQLQIGLLQYTADWDETLPVAARWATLSESAVKGGIASTYSHCPSADSAYSYAFNRALGGLPLSDTETPAETISLFECDAANKDATGGPQDRTHQERHREGLVYALLDGHVKWMNRKYAEQFRWSPPITSKRGRK